MTREEHLIFCKTCLSRRMDMKQGLLCDLSGQKAAFDIECADFKIDDTVKVAPLDNKVGLIDSEIVGHLTFDQIEKLRMQQRLMPGIIAGIVVGVLGAILWGVVTVSTEYQIGYMAVAIGAGVGYTIRKFGNGIDLIFGVMGAVISLVSVLLGNVFSIIGFVAISEGLGYFETLTLIDFSYMPELIIETFSMMDILFYGIAVYEGYKFSFRLITEQGLQELKTKKVW